MIAPKGGFLRNYADIVYLLGGVLTGSWLGYLFRERILAIKPVGDIFLHLLFTAVIPLVFFAISSVIAGLGVSRETGRLIGTMIGVFAGTVSLAAIITLLTLQVFPIDLTLPGKVATAAENQPAAGDQLVQLLTVSDFYELLSRKSMLALIVFSLLTGAAARRAGEAGESFRAFLLSGNAVMKSLLRLIMKLAPLGLGAYFAYQVAVIGPQLFGYYAKTLAIAHGISIFYYLIFFSGYALLAGGLPAVASYWKNNLSPSVTALGTCSSIATIPANLEAAGKMGIPASIADVVIPLGGPLHKEGSAIAAIFKVVAALALVHRGPDSWESMLMALLIALLVSIIEGGIPNGGYIGQLLIVSAYHLPAEVLPVIMIIGTLLDPIATLLNATGDTVAAMLVARLLRDRR